MAQIRAEICQVVGREREVNAYRISQQLKHNIRTVYDQCHVLVGEGKLVARPAGRSVFYHLPREGEQ